MATRAHDLDPRESFAIPTLAWPAFRAEFFRSWQQGEHVSLIGPTGCGKTELARAILPARDYTVVFGTKPVDATLERLRRDGFRRIQAWPPRPGERRVLLWPKFRKPGDVVTQQAVFADALESIFTAGSWCVCLDELRYMLHRLKLEPVVRTYWEMGRALRLSLVGSTQRPSAMPLEMYDGATHLFFWRENDRVNLTRIGGLFGGVDSRALAQSVAMLPRHEFLYLDTRTGRMIRSRVERG